MPKDFPYPFKLINVFFPKICIERAPDYNNEGGSVRLNVLGVNNNFPDEVEIQISLISPEESKLLINLLMIAKYTYIGNDEINDRELIHEFTREKGIYLLWPFITQLFNILTIQVGIQPFTIYTPMSIELNPNSPEMQTK